MDARPRSVPVSNLGMRVSEIFAASECGLLAPGERNAHRLSGTFSPESQGSSSPEFSPTGSDWGSFAEDDIVLVEGLEQSAAGDQENANQEQFAMLSLVEKGKRGRRPIRPFDPIKKKTEEKDKYWLRAFRAYMKTNFPQMKKEMAPEERSFWRKHLSPEGKPEKGNRYLSYGKQYKNALFSDASFVHRFQHWFRTYGESELLKKCERGSATWFVFYDYGSKELFHYSPNGAASDSGSVSPAFSDSSAPEQVPDADFDITMVDGEGAVDTLLDGM